MTGSRLASSPQARAALAISVLYVVTTGLLRPTLLHVVVSAVKMLSMTYTVSCMVSGGCGVLGWANVAGLALFWLADVLALVAGAHRSGRDRESPVDSAPIIRSEIRASVSATP